MNQPGSFATLAEWLPWLETLSPREIVLGLERVTGVLDELALPRPDLVINVGGTNGKGSSVAMLESLLAAAGRRTGCYTSPHVHRYNERIRIAGRPADDEAIIDALRRVQAARGELPLTFFEFGTLAALVAFAEAGADALVLEVGMGGRLDAVNAVEPDACLVTNVALDHMAWLGEDVESIAAEKAGIMRGGRPAVFGGDACPTALREHAAAIGADLRLRPEDFDYQLDGDLWSWRGRRIRLEGLPPPGLAGAAQFENAAAVLAVLEALEFDALLVRDRVAGCFAAVSLAGRFQQVSKGRDWVFDVAHNPAAACRLAATLAEAAAGRPVTAVIGMFADKDVGGVVRELAGQVDRWIAVRVPGPRAASAASVARDVANATGQPCLVAPALDDALAMAVRGSGTEDILLVTGSFYLVGPALDWVEGGCAGLC